MTIDNIFIGVFPIFGALRPDQYKVREKDAVPAGRHTLVSLILHSDTFMRNWFHEGYSDCHEFCMSIQAPTALMPIYAEA